MSFPRTIALLKTIDLGHPTEEVSPHGLSVLGYLKRASTTDNTELVFAPWPAEADAHAIYSTYVSELVAVEAQAVTATSEALTVAWITELVEYCRQISAEHGFHERGVTKMQRVYEAAGVVGAPGDPEYLEEAKADFVDYLNTRLLLIVSEVTEAQDELRSGRGVADVYYKEATPQKPEGFLSELVDALVRTLDLAGELDKLMDGNFAEDFARMFVQKTKYNASRPFLHGRSF